MTKTCIVPVLTLLLLLMGGLTDSHGFERTRTSSGAGYFWPSAEVTLNLRVGCPSSGSLTDWGPCWDDAAGDAAARWNAAGAQFEFLIRRTSVSASLCADDGLNTVGWASTQLRHAPWSRRPRRDAQLLANSPRVKWWTAMWCLIPTSIGTPMRDHGRRA